MSELSWAQVRGIADLIHDGVALVVDLTAQTHQAIARQPFAVLERIPGIARPAAAINDVQRTITQNVYSAIHAVNNAAGIIARQVLNHLEHRAENIEQKGE